jgi:phosphoenolpyruvate carboxykinase (ATP)
MEYDVHPVFNLRMPRHCPGVDSHILNPRRSGTDKTDDDAAAAKLSHMFRANFEKNGFSRFGIDAVI